MKIAIFGQTFDDSFSDAIYKIFEKLNKNKVTIIVYDEFLKYIREHLFFEPKISEVFDSVDNFPRNVDLIFSIGGDGTFLKCVSYAKISQTPIVGINSGRLGFLAYISKEEISDAIDNIIKKNYSIEQRTLIELITDNRLFAEQNYALNEITVQKRDSSAMISVDVYMNDELLNKYWADGLIIATPTGSTAYSLSAGGPIIVPGSGNLVITPLAPHNLTVRPIVLSDDNILKLKVTGRSQSFMVALDFRTEVFDQNTVLTVKKASFTINMIKLKNSNFFTTLRNKLMWGLDKRN